MLLIRFCWWLKDNELRFTRGRPQARAGDEALGDLMPRRMRIRGLAAREIAHSVRRC